MTGITTTRTLSGSPAATDDSSVSQSFTVTVGAYAGPTDPAIDFKPLATPVTTTVKENGASTAVTLAGQDGYPDPMDPGTLTYSLVSQPGDGTISDFNASTGTFDYTPDPGFSGTDTFQYQVQQVGPAPLYGTADGEPLYGTAATTTSDATTVTITVTPTPTPTITWAAPANIVYGTALTAKQLDATASVPGTFTYSPPLGTILQVGNDQTLSITFTPANTTDYTTVRDATTINVPAPKTTVVSPTSTPLVTVTGIQLEENRKRQVDEILVTLSGPVDASEADSTATYRLTTAGKKGSFTAKDARIISLSSASYDAANDTIALIPKKPFALSKKVQLVVYGGPPSGLQDSQGRYIDGNDDGQAGGNVARILSRSGVSLDAVAMASPSVGSISATNEINVLLAQSTLDGLIHAPAAREHRD
jgi:hypothetical protein